MYLLCVCYTNIPHSISIINTKKQIFIVIKTPIYASPDYKIDLVKRTQLAVDRVVSRAVHIPETHRGVVRGLKGVCILHIFMGAIYVVSD